MKRKMYFSIVIAMVALLTTTVFGATINVPADHLTIQAAINAANPNDVIEVDAGTYPQTTTLNINKSVTLQGAGSATTTIDLTALQGSSAYGITTTADNITFSGFTILHPEDPAPGTQNGFTLKAGNTSASPLNSNLIVSDLKIDGAERTPFDFHGIDGITVTDLEANNTVGGNGMQFTGCTDVVVNSFTGTNNAWGSIAIYATRYTSPDRASDNVTINGAGLSIDGNVFSQDDINGSNDLFNTNISVNGWDYNVFNDDFRSQNDGPEYTFFAEDLAAATAIAEFLNLQNGGNTASAIQQISSGEWFVTNDNLSIQAAINEANPGDVIEVASGTYNEAIDINKQVSIIGAGSSNDPLENSILTANATLAGDSKNGVVQISGSGSINNPILIKDFRIEPQNIAGISIGQFYQSTNTVVSNLEFDNVYVVGNNNADPCGEQERGLYVDNTSSINNLTIKNSAFNKLDYGWYFQKAVSSDISNVTNVHVSNTKFLNNVAKGIYTEKLSNATFENCEVKYNGDASWSSGCQYFRPWLAGFDINLKAGSYSNLLFENCEFEGNGIGDAREGVGLTVKARDDGSTYGAFPATVDNIQILNSSFIDNERGVRIGEPGKGNSTPTNVIVNECIFENNLQTYSGTDGSDYGAIINQTSATDPINAKFNYWGSTPDFNTLISGSVDYCPWYSDAAMTVVENCPPVKNLTQSKYYTEIQPAVDEANPGDVIEVGDGTYNENVDVHTPCTIQNGSTPVVVGMFDINADNVTIDGMTINNPNGNFAIVSIDHGDLTVKNNTITNIGDNVLGGNSHAIYVKPNSNDINNVVIKDNTFTTIRGGESNSPSTNGGNGSASAVYIGDTTSDYDVNGLEITGNTISDVNAAIIPWASNNAGGKGAYGILLGVGAKSNASGKINNANITNNDISDIEGHWAHGIGLEGDTPGAKVKFNSIDNLTDHKSPSDAVAVMVEDNDGSGSVLINFNSFTNTNVGVVNLTMNEVNAENNWWGDCSGPAPTNTDTRCTETAIGIGAIVTCLVDFDPWVGKGGTDAALWLSPATLAGNVQSSVPLWEGISCASLDAVMSDGNRQPLYDSFVQFSPDPYWANSDAMEVESDQDVTTSITQVNGNGQTSKSIYVAFTPEAPSNGTQFIFEIGGQISGVSLAIQQGFLVAGMWNSWERKFWTSSTALVAGEDYLAQVQFVRDESVSPVVSKFRVILNGVASNWVDFRGLVWDNSPSGIGAGVKGTALKNVYYAHDHVNHFDGKIKEIIVINNQSEVQSADMYNDLMSVYGLTGPTVTPKQAWNLEVWEDIPLEEDGFELFPNPAQYSATLRLNLIENSNVNVSLVSASGKVVSTPYSGIMSQGVNIIDIDTDKLPPGVYNTVIEIGCRTKTERLVIIK